MRGKNAEGQKIKSKRISFVRQVFHETQPFKIWALFICDPVYIETDWMLSTILPIGSTCAKSTFFCFIPFTCLHVLDLVWYSVSTFLWPKEFHSKRSLRNFVLHL
jgi:hypothetical protein